jgi:hypothetical protein
VPGAPRFATDCTDGAARAVFVAPAARGTSTGTTLIGVRAPSTADAYDLDAMRAWQGKRDAVALVFRKATIPAAELVAKMTSVWNQGSGSDTSRATCSAP